MNKMKAPLNPEIESYAQKFAQNPTSRIFAPLADAYRKSGMLDEAIDVCMKGLKFHPNYMSAHVVLGKIYLHKGMVVEARKEFENVLEIDPDNLVALSILGEIYKKLSLPNEAKEKYDKILKLDPFNESAKKALELLAEQAKVQVKEEEIYNAYQEEVAEKEKIKEAKLQSEPVKEAPKIFKPKAWEDDDINTLTMAELYYKQGMVVEAKRVCSKILRRDPLNEDVKKLLQRIDKIETKQSEQEPVVEIKQEKILTKVPEKIQEEVRLDKVKDIISEKLKVEDLEAIDSIIDNVPKKETKPLVQDKVNREIKEDVKIERIKEEVEKPRIRTRHIEEKVTVPSHEWESFLQTVEDEAKSKDINKPQTKTIESSSVHKEKPVNPLEDWIDFIRSKDD